MLTISLIDATAYVLRRISRRRTATTAHRCSSNV